MIQSDCKNPSLLNKFQIKFAKKKMFTSKIDFVAPLHTPAVTKLWQFLREKKEMEKITGGILTS